MTVEQQLYGPALVKCARCGVLQRLGAISKGPDFVCLDAAKCAEGKIERERIDAEFRLTHPELHAGKVKR